MRLTVFFLTILFLVSSCSIPRIPCSPLASINIVDANGITETISNEERLKQFDTVDFLVPQPYKKVLRVYKRNDHGNIEARLTTYHPNGELKQYLEILNGRAFGEYCCWYDSGVKKVQARVIGGPGDLFDNVEKSWLFDGTCTAFSEIGQVEAEIPYCKGKREGVAYYYHKNGSIWKEIYLHNDKLHGPFIVYFDNGTLFERLDFWDGKKVGQAYRFWFGGAKAAEESYEDDLLMEGRYYSPRGELVSEISKGSGFKALFGKDSVIELHEYQGGQQEGLVKILGRKGEIVRTYSIKDGLKHGEEVEYQTLSTKPKLSISWYKGKIQGLVKSWYPNGVQENQREMVDNKKTGILSAWYKDGSLMLIENYDQDKLIKGEYFKHGDNFPVSTVNNGEGIATLFDPNGLFIRKVTYSNGKPTE